MYLEQPLEVDLGRGIKDSGRFSVTSVLDRSSSSEDDPVAKCVMESVTSGLIASLASEDKAEDSSEESPTVADTVDKVMKEDTVSDSETVRDSPKLLPLSVFDLS